MATEKDQLEYASGDRRSARFQLNRAGWFLLGMLTAVVLLEGGKWLIALFNLRYR